MKNTNSKEEKFLLLYSELEKVVSENANFYKKTYDKGDFIREVSIKTLTPLNDIVDLISFFIKSSGFYVPKHYENIFYSISYRKREEANFFKGENILKICYNRNYFLEMYQIVKNICKIEKLKYEFLEENKEFKKIDTIKETIREHSFSNNRKLYPLMENTKYTTLLHTSMLFNETYLDSIKSLYIILGQLEEKLPKFLDIIESIVNGNQNSYEELLYRGIQ